MTASVQTGGRDRELCCTTVWSASDDGVNRKNKFSHRSLSQGCKSLTATVAWSTLSVPHRESDEGFF